MFLGDSGEYGFLSSGGELGGLLVLPPPPGLFGLEDFLLFLDEGEGDPLRDFRFLDEEEFLS